MSKTDKQLKQIANRIRKTRELKGLSQEFMAQQIHVSLSAYSRLERNEIQLTIDKLIRIASALNVSLDDLLIGEPSEENMEALNDSGLRTLSKVDLSKIVEAYEGQTKALKEQIEFLKEHIRRIESGK